MSKRLVVESYLAHHGIPGQHWGQKNGPPYPLDQKTHNKVVKNREKSGKGDSKKDGYVPIFTLTYLAIYTTAAVATITAAAIQKHSANKQYNKFLEHRETEKTDKKTGLKLKDTEMTDEEDMKLVNPLLKTGETSFSNNCAYCTFTFDMRKRGYDVTAGMNSSGFDRNDISKVYKNAKLSKEFKPEKYVDPRYTKLADQEKAYADDLKANLRKQGEGARGNLGVTWKYAFAGHSVVYQVKNGNLEIIDTQNRIKYDTDKKIDDFLSRTRGAQFTRLDNLQPNVNYMKKEGIIR